MKKSLKYCKFINSLNNSKNIQKLRQILWQCTKFIFTYYFSFFILLVAFFPIFWHFTDKIIGVVITLCLVCLLTVVYIFFAFYNCKKKKAEFKIRWLVICHLINVLTAIFLMAMFTIPILRHWLIVKITSTESTEYISLTINLATICVYFTSIVAPLAFELPTLEEINKLYYPEDLFLHTFLGNKDNYFDAERATKIIFGKERMKMVDNYKFLFINKNKILWSSKNRLKIINNLTTLTSDTLLELKSWAEQCRATPTLLNSTPSLIMPVVIFLVTVFINNKTTSLGNIKFHKFHMSTFLGAALVIVISWLTVAVYRLRKHSKRQEKYVAVCSLVEEAILKKKQKNLNSKSIILSSTDKDFK